MQRNRPPSEQTTTVLLALAEDPTAWRHGYELCQQTELKAGSMYPILIRLADRGLLETTWESEIPVGRPPRHLYRLTEAGLELANELGEKRMLAAKAKRARLRPRMGGA
ncbi:MAG: helix-turn-helix transcriptional regulator [Acidobacteria bacterium]|nr:helix-turn-helix transcriptional regulator [Acidobacteriota bacterium]